MTRISGKSIPEEEMSDVEERVGGHGSRTKEECEVIRVPADDKRSAIRKDGERKEHSTGSTDGKEETLVGSTR